MYAYVFDSFLQDRKYQTDINQIETRLATLGVQGRSEKMTILKNIQESAREAIKRGATTLVIVGNDATITKVLPQLIEHPVTLGIIPLGPDQSIAELLGIPTGLAACDVLSRRIVHRIDLGQANELFFLSTLVAPASVSVDCGPYTITSLDPGGILSMSNFPTDVSAGHPDDGKIELLVAPSQERKSWGGFRRGPKGSVFSIHKAKLTSAETSATIILDGQVSVRTPVTLRVAKQKLEVIVGKQRHF